MTFLPYELLEFALTFLNDDNYDKEIRYRTVISRAYYAAFLLSDQRLQSIGYNIQKEYSVDCPNCGSDVRCGKSGSHISVITSIKEINKTIGDMLGQLREKRVDADYKLNSHIDLDMAIDATKKSEIIIGKLSNLRKKRLK